MFHFIIAILIITTVLAAATLLYVRQDRFGANPSGARLQRMRQSPNYRNGKFRNLSETPVLAEGHNYPEVIYKSYFKKKPRHRPAGAIPSVKTDLLQLPAEAKILVWFGHSSYFIQIDGKRMLVDPVFSGNASPVPGTVKAFRGTDVYTADDLPPIDYLFISHDHYDHVDYKTLVALKGKVGKVICGLGVGAHFERWGYAAGRIIEKDWYEKVELDAGFTVYVEPARHFSGRGLSAGSTLWVSYLLQTPSTKIYLGGDSGYDAHYADIGKKYGPVDLAILDNGQYDEAWKYIHNLPEDVLRAAQDLRARRILPVHSSKFALANHAWDEPLAKLSELNRSYHFDLVTPRIGEAVDLDNTDQQFDQWWVGVG